jgi:hypothetical protein
MGWNHSIKIKHLFTKKEDYEAVQASMTDIAGVVEGNMAFRGFNTETFHKIPEGDKTFSPIEYANRYIDQLYNYADARRIWIE